MAAETPMAPVPKRSVTRCVPVPSVMANPSRLQLMTTIALEATPPNPLRNPNKGESSGKLGTPPPFNCNERDCLYTNLFLNPGRSSNLGR